MSSLARKILMAMTMRRIDAEPSRLISASRVMSICICYLFLLAYERATPRDTILRNASAGAAFLLAFLGGECP